MGSLDFYLQQLKQDPTFRGFFGLVCQHGKKVAGELLEKDQIKTLTYEQQVLYCYATAERIRERLPAEPGTRFAGLRMENSPMWPVMFWGLVMAGLNPILLDTRHQPEQIEHLIKQVDAIALFDADAGLSVGACPVIAVSDVLDDSGRACGYEPVWAKYYALCTSGTTATSKVYYYEAKTLCAQVSCISSLTKDFAYTDAPYKSLAFLPFNHVFGLLTVFILCSFFGGTVVYLSERTPAVIVEACKRHRVTHVFTVPLFWNNVAQNVMRKAKLGGREDQLQKLVKVSLMLQRRFKRIGRKLVSKYVAGKVQDALLGRDIRLTITGGGHILPDAMKLINVLGYQLVNGFGMTEIGIASVETTADVDLRNAASTGKPMPGIEYFVMTEDGLKAEGVGELLVKSAYVHNGRYINGADTGPELDENGYFRTGDIGRIDKTGRLWIEGRLKEVIINESGENVYPDELEDAFLELPHTEQICITGIDAGQTYEDITMVAYMGDARADEKSVRELAEAFAKANAPLPVYKKVRTVIVSREPMPLANGIKVKRQSVRRMVEDGSLACDILDIREGRLMHKENAEETVQTPGVIDEADLRAIKDEIKAIFSEVLSLKPEEISDTAHFIYDLGGDSLSSLAVFIKAEEKYGVLISDTDYYGCENVNDLANVLYAKIKGVEISEQKPGTAAAQAVRRVETFEQSREYEDFMLQLRMAEVVGNPFFIAHDSVLRDTSIYDGRRVLNFASYNYLGLSGHPETMRAAQEAIDKYGTSASGSRLIAGEKPLYQELEAKIAEWKHTEAALVLVGGHSTNVTFVGNFCNKHDLILYDALSHNSITQGCQLSSAETKAFPHNDYEALESILKANRDRYEKVLIIVEGVYSMDGDIAPVKEFVRIKRAYGAFLMVDEAHSGCVIGESGGGVDDYFNLAPDDIDIKMGTLSKGLGACGGYLAGKKAMIDYLRYNVPGFVFSVGISPPLAAAAKRAIELIEENPGLVKKLHANIKAFVDLAQAKGFNTCLAKESSIIPILIGRDEDAALLSRLMLENGVFVPPAIFPAVPRNQARLRFCVISEHNPEQIETALNTLERLVNEHGIQTAKMA